MPKQKKKQDSESTGDVRYLELLMDDFRDYMQESREDIKDIRETMSTMKVDFSRELGGIQQAITGSNARIKKVEDKTSTLKTDVAQMSVKHPNGASKYLLWKMFPWLLMALISGAAFTGYAFSGLSDFDTDVVEQIEQRLNKKIEKEVDKISNDIDYLIEQEQDGGV